MGRKLQTDGQPLSAVIFALLSAVFARLTSILGKIGISNIDSNPGTTVNITICIVSYIFSDIIFCKIIHFVIIIFISKKLSSHNKSKYNYNYNYNYPPLLYPHIIPLNYQRCCQALTHEHMQPHICNNNSGLFPYLFPSLSTFPLYLSFLSAYSSRNK